MHKRELLTKEYSKIKWKEFQSERNWNKINIKINNKNSLITSGDCKVLQNFNGNKVYWNVCNVEVVCSLTYNVVYNAVYGVV